MVLIFLVKFSILVKYSIIVISLYSNINMCFKKDVIVLVVFIVLIKFIVIVIVLYNNINIKKYFKKDIIVL